MTMSAPESTVPPLDSARRDPLIRKAAWSAALAASGAAANDGPGIGNLFGVAARSAQGAGATPAQAVSIAQTLEDVMRSAGDPGALTAEETIERAIIAAEADASRLESPASSSAPGQPPATPPAMPDNVVFRANLLELGKSNRDEWFTLEALEARFPGAPRLAIEGPLSDLTREGFVRREGDYLFVTEPGLRFLEYSQLAS